LNEVVSVGPILIWAVVICSDIYNTVELVCHRLINQFA